MIIARVLAVLAALHLVVAFAVATLLPPDVTLAQGLAELDPSILYGLQDTVSAPDLSWLWDDVLAPVLQRPDWLLPTSLGLVFAGGALTLGSRKSVPRSHRRRS